MVTPRLGDDLTITLYGQDTTPLVRVVSSERSATHDRIGKPPVQQDLGPALDEVEVRGECAPETADSIDDLRGVIAVRTERWRGQARVVETETAPMQKRYDGERVYEYTVSLTEVEE